MKTHSILFLLLLISCSQEEANIPVEKNITVDQKKSITDGEFIEYHPNGNVKTKGLLKNGKRTGTWTAYHANGNLYSENKYKADIRNGKTAAYYPNGNVQYMGLYINNEKDDHWFFYSEDGAFEKDVLFKNGERILTTP